MSDRPTPPPYPTADQVPVELRSLKRWCGWKAAWDDSKQKWRKPPHSPVTGEAIGAVEKWNAHWLTFVEARAGVEKNNLDGVGFVFVAADGYVGIDFDDCTDGQTEAEVLTLLKLLPSYTETSPSGKGIHAICRGKIPKALTATSLPNAGKTTVEMYCTGRYFTFTGLGLGAKTIGDCQVGIERLRAHLGEKEQPASSAASQTEQPWSVESVRSLYEKKLSELRAAPDGKGNALLNDTALIAARVYASKVFDKTDQQFRHELLDIVTKEWANPHPEHGAKQTILSGWSKGAKEGAYNLIEVAKPEEITRPDMPASVLCGRLGEICRTRLTDFPVAYSWLAVLAAASVLVKPHPMHRCNIYVAPVGLPDSGKSEAQRRANYLFALDKQDGLLLSEKFGSAEGMLEKIGDRKGDSVLWSPDELSHVLEKAQIQGASFPFILNTLFYNDRNNLTVQHRKHITFNARVTIAGGVVEENFGNSFGAATTAGLYSRFLFGLCPSGFRYLYRPMEGAPVVEETLTSATLPFGGTSDTTLQIPRRDAPDIHPDVWAARDEIHHEEKIEPRLLELCIRTAIICAAWDARPVLRASDLEPAWELARYQRRVRGLLQPNPGRNFDAMAAHKIMAYLAQHSVGDKWLACRDLIRATHVVKEFGPSVVSRALSALASAGEIEEASIPRADGRKGRNKWVVRLARES